MGRRAALVIGAVMLATALCAAVHAQTPEPTYQVGQPPPDMPADDGARMAALEAQALVAIETGDWAKVDALVREGLTLEQRHYAPDDARIGHSWGWLARAAIERGMPTDETLPLAAKRLEIAEKHPDDGATLAAARHMAAVELVRAGRASEGVDLLRQVETWLIGRGAAAHGDLRVVRAALARALIAAGDREAAAAVLAELTAEAAADSDEGAAVAWELAVVQHDLSHFAEAASLFRTVMERSAARAFARDETLAAYWLADTLTRMERLQEADEVLARVVTLETAATPAERGLTVDQTRTVMTAHGDRMRTAGDHGRAEAAYRLMVEINRSRPEEKTFLAASLGRLGLTLAATGRHEEAEAAQTEALALWREIHDGPNENVAAQLEQLGRTRLKAHKDLEAFVTLASANDIRVQLGQTPTLGVLDDTADAAEGAGRLQQAAQLRGQIVQRLAAEQPRRPDALAGALGDMGHAFYLVDLNVDAEGLYRRALTLAADERLIERLNTGLAFALSDQGRGDEGEPLQRAVLAAIAARDGPESLSAAVAMNDLAKLLAQRGDHARAESLIRDALALFEAAPEGQGEWIATLKHSLATTLNAQGRFREALGTASEVYRDRLATYGPAHPVTITAIGLIVRQYIGLGAYDRAEPLLARIAEVREALVGPEHPLFAQALQMHAYILQYMDRSSEAEPLMRRAVGIIEHWSQDPREKIRYNANWGVTLLYSDRPTEALDVFRRAQADLVERRRTATDPNWSRNEAESFRFLHRFAVQAAWQAAAPSSP